MKKKNNDDDYYRRLLKYEDEKRMLRDAGVTLTQDVLDKLIKKHRI